MREGRLLQTLRNALPCEIGVDNQTVMPLGRPIIALRLVMGCSPVLEWAIDLFHFFRQNHSTVFDYEFLFLLASCMVARMPITSEARGRLVVDNHEIAPAYRGGVAALRTEAGSVGAIG